MTARSRPPSWSRSSSGGAPTRSHTRRRVAALAVEVAQLARLPEAEIRQIYWGALVHDIGELDVPEAIFATPGPLATDRAGSRRRAHRDRRALAREHARDCRRSCPTPAGITNASTATGYPDRRGGHEVPLTVALVTVCDCWDAMTEPRPYRVTYSIDDAIEEMRRSAGRQWSRVLVDWLLETVEARSVDQAQAG